MDLHTQLIEAFFQMSRLMKEEMGYSSRLCHLSLVQLQALVFLKKNPDAQMGEIATNFKIELPSATSLMNTLSKLDLVERKADKKDRRLVRISLTQQGTALLADAMKARKKKLDETLKHLSKEDKKSLLDIIQKLISKMEVPSEK